jgi:hypothetical protein
MSLEQTKALYISIENAASQLGIDLGKLKAQLQTQHIHTSRKKFFEGGQEVMRWAILRSDFQKMVAAQQAEKYSMKTGFEKPPTRQTKNGVKPSTKLTGE